MIMIVKRDEQMGLQLLNQLRSLIDRQPAVFQVVRERFD